MSARERHAGAGQKSAAQHERARYSGVRFRIAGHAFPEDPVLAKRSEEQWRQHMQDEERERKLGFDRRHAGEHRAVIGLIKAGQKRYDRATTAADLARARAEMPHRLDDIQKRVTEIDHWGTNSRLLSEYAALEASLADPYPTAKAAALEGKPLALEQERKSFAAHLDTIAKWLEQANAAEED